MKHTDPVACITCGLLKFIRDSNPTESEMIAWLGNDSDAGRFHVLRKAGLLVIDDGRVALSPDHLSPDRVAFVHGNRVYKIDDDVIMYVCRGPVPDAQNAR